MWNETLLIWMLGTSLVESLVINAVQNTAYLYACTVDCGNQC